MRLGYLMKYGLSRKSVFACSAKKKKAKKKSPCLLSVSELSHINPTTYQLKRISLKHFE